MSLIKISDTLNRILRPITKFFHSIGMIILAVLMGLTAVDVIIRNITSFLNNIGVGSTVSLPGWFELTEYSMALLIAFTLAYCGIEKGHVVIELVVSRFSGRIQAIIGSITSFLSLGLVFLIT